MFVEKVYHSIKCDKCNISLKDYCGNENFDNDFEAIDVANDQLWEFVKVKGSESFLHYCPECANGI